MCGSTFAVRLAATVVRAENTMVLVLIIIAAGVPERLFYMVLACPVLGAHHRRDDPGSSANRSAGSADRPLIALAMRQAKRLTSRRTRKVVERPRRRPRSKDDGAIRQIGGPRLYKQRIRRDDARCAGGFFGRPADAADIPAVVAGDDYYGLSMNNSIRLQTVTRPGVWSWTATGRSWRRTGLPSTVQFHPKDAAMSAGAQRNCGLPERAGR